MRESYNIFLFIGFKDWKRVFNLFLTLFHKQEGNYTRLDTWNGFKEITWCKIFSHKPDYSNIKKLGKEQDIFCEHCSQYMKTLSHKEHEQLLRELKLKRIIEDGEE